MQPVKLSFNTPITENASYNGEFLIKGTAINATTTDNNHTFLAEELEKAASSMKDIPLLVDHDNRVDSIKGRVKQGFFNESDQKIDFEALVQDRNVQQKIKSGLVNSVSIGATVGSIEEGADGEIIPRDIRIRELSLVAVPADAGATFTVSSSADNFAMALKEAFNIKETPTSQKPHAYKVERGTSDMEKKTENTNSQVEELTKKLESANAKLAEYAAKERKALEAEYSKVCEAKKVLALDVSKLDSATIKLLMEQVEGVEEAEEEEPKAEEVVAEPESEAPVEEAEEDDDEEVAEESSKYKIQEGNGSIRGGSFTAQL